MSRSKLCLYIVAVLALIHKRGGRRSFLMASPRSSVVWTRDSRISRRLPALYRQLTLRPARLMTTSASSNSLVQSPRFAPLHQATRQGATAVVRARTVIAFPLACRWRATIRPRCPAPPGMTTRSGRGGRDRSWVLRVFGVSAVTSSISVHTEYTGITRGCQLLFWPPFPLALRSSHGKDVRMGETLDLSNSGLTALAADVWQRRDLTELNLYLNRLSAVPPEIGRLASLEILILANNRLTHLPEEFGNFLHLRALDLGHNQLAELPQSFGRLTGLSDYLYLHDNRLRTLADLLFEKFGKLRYLNLGDNPLRELPPSLASLTSLEELRLENIGLETLSDWIGSLSQLDELALRNNNLSALPESLAGLDRLRRFDLRGNQFQDAPPVLATLSQLQKLDLRWNKVPWASTVVAELRGRGCRVLL